MFVNTNVAALNAWRNLENTQTSMNGVLQQLSSGYKINSAADNPAGLAISQQMQSQIDGMNQANQNAQSGISFLQTADGALSQIQNILQSMYSLATQAANGTNVGVDRGSIQSQMNQYTKEINSITNQTAFNNKNLLDGVLGNVNLAIGADPNQALQFSLGAVDAKSLGVSGQNPNSVAFGSASTAATYGLSALALYGGSSTSNPYGSYGLTGTNYGLQITAAQQSAAAINGGSQTSLVSTTTAAGSNGFTESNTLTGLSGTAGTMKYDALTYSGTTSQNISVQVQAVTPYTSGTAGTTTYNVLYSTDGGSTYTTVASGLSTLTGTQQLGTTGASVDLSKITAPTQSGTAAGSGTATSTDTYNIALTPESASVQLVDSNGTAIGSATTINAATTNPATVGNANDGQAVSVNVSASTLFGASSGVTYGTNGAATSTLGSGAASNFALTYATNTAAAGSGGTVQQKASVGGGLSVMNYSQATTAQTAIQAALTQISGERAQVGSLMNRLTQASNDLQTSQQNLTTARGGIMNADMALAMVKLSKDQVLQQSGVAMLAQANQVPQALLKLLP